MSEQRWQVLVQFIVRYVYAIATTPHKHTSATTAAQYHMLQLVWSYL
jgi:hypothetical protein